MGRTVIPDPGNARPGLLAAIPRELVSASDYERFARARLDDNAWEYLASGAGDEITLRENQTAFDRLRLKGRVLGDVRGGHTQCELFGRTHAHPLLLAPVAYQKLFHPEGERATALGAGAMAATMVVSTLGSVRLEEIAAARATPLWLQLYLQSRRADTLTLIKRAEDSGCEVLVVTVDAPLAGIRHREQRAGFQLPPGGGAVNLMDMPAPLAAPNHGHPVFDRLMAHAPGWEEIAWLASATRLPVVLKGILDADDARLAIRHGARGIIVSNHGGRVLDGVPATIDALPAIAAAVAGEIPVLLDGGIRRGGDVFKAIALGASAVLVGRPYVHALATAGALGVAHLLRTLCEELEITMALSGCATLSAIDPSVLHDKGARQCG